MKISRKLAIKILKYLNKNKDFYFPFSVICREYKNFETELKDWKVISTDKKLKSFELRENLQNLHKETVDLMAKGFIEKITGKSLEKYISKLAKDYRKEWKEELWESEDIEEFGLNEFIGGKADAYEDCLDLIKEYSLKYKI